jgi:hypothetical protein
MKRLIALLALAIGCSNAAAPPPVVAGAGISVDGATQTVSVDPKKVPMLPDCKAQQLVERGSGDSWVCASSAPDADKLGSKAATEYALKSGTVANADQLGGRDASEYALSSGTVANSSTLEGHPAADFLGVNAAAVDSARLGGKLPTDFLAATGKAADSAKLGGKLPGDFLAVDGKAADSAKLGGKLPTEFLGATAKAADSALLGGKKPTDFLGVNDKAPDSSKLAGLTADNFVLQDPKTHVIDLQGDIDAGDASAAPGHRIVLSNKVCLVSERTGCTKFAPLPTSSSVEGVFCGASATTTGNLDQITEPDTTVKAVGYRAAKLVCERVPSCGPRAHMCTSQELIRSETLGVAGAPGQLWFASGDADCKRWSLEDATPGAVWIFNRGVTQTGCSAKLSIACCQ